MTRERAKEICDVISAYADGKKIERTDGRGRWIDLECNLDLEMLEKYPYSYRVKPI